jgi:hypothetical protein
MGGKAADHLLGPEDLWGHDAGRPQQPEWLGLPQQSLQQGGLPVGVPRATGAETKGEAGPLPLKGAPPAPTGMRAPVGDAFSVISQHRQSGMKE